MIAHQKLDQLRIGYGHSAEFTFVSTIGCVDMAPFRRSAFHIPCRNDDSNSMKNQKSSFLSSSLPLSFSRIE